MVCMIVLREISDLRYLFPGQNRISPSSELFKSWLKSGALNVCVKGQKYECARKWNIYCVSLHWLFDSIEKGFCQDESRYTVERGAAKPTQLHTSTPTKGGRKDGEGSGAPCGSYQGLGTQHPVTRVTVGHQSVHQVVFMYAYTWLMFIVDGKKNT